MKVIYHICYQMLTILIIISKDLDNESLMIVYIVLHIFFKIALSSLESSKGLVILMNPKMNYHSRKERNAQLLGHKEREE